MVRIYISILLLLTIKVFAVNDKDLQGKPEKHLMPLADTLDVIEIKKQDYEDFIMQMGEYSEICPVLIDIEKPNGDYFLPHRIFYDEDCPQNIRDSIDMNDKAYLIITEKKIKVKEVKMEEKLKVK